MIRLFGTSSRCCFSRSFVRQIERYAVPFVTKHGGNKRMRSKLPLSASSTFWQQQQRHGTTATTTTARSYSSSSSSSSRHNDDHVKEEEGNGNILVLRHDNSDDGITTLTLNRPRQYNTLTLEMLNALSDELHDIALNHTSSIKVVILKSSSAPKCFSPGHDLKQLLFDHHDNDDTITTTTPEEQTHYHRHLFETCSNVMMFLSQRLPQPIIAQVDGTATAAGCQLVASCDLAICSRGSKFGINGINVGLACSTPAVSLSHPTSNTMGCLPRKVILEMLWTGNFLSSRQALQYGLVNHVVDNDDDNTNDDLLNKVTMDVARKVAGRSSAAVQLSKRAFYHQVQLPTLGEAYDYCGNVMCDNLQTYDAQEGITAFLEKRQPKPWKGK